MDLDQLLTVPVIRRGQFVAHLSAVAPPLHQPAPEFLTGACVHAVGVVRDLDQRFSGSDLRRDPVGVFGTGAVS